MGLSYDAVIVCTEPPVFTEADILFNIFITEAILEPLISCTIWCGKCSPSEPVVVVKSFSGLEFPSLIFNYIFFPLLYYWYIL